MPKYWLYFIGYGLLIFSSQILWVTFSPITTDIAGLMEVNVGKIGTLAALFPIVYILIGFPSGRWLDTHFKLALGFGAFAMGAGAMLRNFFPVNYHAQLSIQIFLAIGQPFIVNSMTTYARNYIPEKNRSLAISLSGVALFLGNIFPMIFSPILFDRYGLTGIYIVYAIISLAAMAFVGLILWTQPTQIHSPASGEKSVPLSVLFRDKTLWILCGLLAIGLGIFDVLNTWYEPIFKQLGISKDTSGMIMAGMLVAGIVSSAFLPTIVAKKDARRTYMTIALAVTMGTFIAIALWHWIPWVILWMISMGFLLMAGLPVIMDWTGKHFDAHQQGTAVGFLMLCSHAGGVILIYTTSLFIDSAQLTLFILAGIAMLGFLLIGHLPKRENHLTVANQS